MVKVNYASLQTQSSTMSSASQSRVAGFNQLISAFDSFGGSGGELIGTGYDAARVYATSVMSPYYKGCILYSEAVADAANTLADSYAAKCGAENLDEEQLQAEIDSATRGCMSLSASISGLQSKSKPAAGDAARISSLQNQLTAAQNQLTAAQEKLDNLRAFSAESPSACASADGYQGLVSKAMSGISVSFGGGGFALPEDLTWVSDVEQGWADREIAMENNYLSALDKVYNGESLTEAELTAIERYAAAYPDRVDSSVLEYVQKARQVKAEEMKIRGLIDKVDEGKVLTTEETKTLQDYQSNHPDSNLLENVKHALQSSDEKKDKKISEEEAAQVLGVTVPEMKDFIDYAKSIGESALTYRGAKVFLNGIEITLDSQGRMRWGNKFIFNPSNAHLYRNGSNFQQASGIDLKKYHYSGNLKGVSRLKEMGKAGWEGFKESVNPINDFKGWKEVGKLGKLAKGVGILSTAATVWDNWNTNITSKGGLSVKGARDFILDTTVDIGSGAAAAGLGAAIGSAFFPPLGTVVGAVAGVGINLVFNNVEIGGDSLVGHTKNIVKGIGDGVGNLIGSLFGG